MPPNPKIQRRDNLPSLLNRRIPFPRNALHHRILQHLTSQHILRLVRAHNTRSDSRTQDRLSMIHNKDIRRLLQVETHSPTDHTPERSKVALGPEILVLLETRLQRIGQIIDSSGGDRGISRSRVLRPREADSKCALPNTDEGAALGDTCTLRDNARR